MSNGKKKGQGNTKNSNKYLWWEFVEAVHVAARCNRVAKRFCVKKLATTNGAVATAETFDVKRCFAGCIVWQGMIESEKSLDEALAACAGDP